MQISIVGLFFLWILAKEFEEPIYTAPLSHVSPTVSACSWVTSWPKTKRLNFETLQGGPAGWVPWRDSWRPVDFLRSGGKGEGAAPNLGRLCMAPRIGTVFFLPLGLSWIILACTWIRRRVGPHPVLARFHRSEQAGLLRLPHPLHRDLIPRQHGATTHPILTLRE
ncbi:hypothetical protein JTE90_026663, partial [Oedothorax gibbosus]